MPMQLTIMAKFPSNDWQKGWTNLHAADLNCEVDLLSVWFRVIHGTNVRLYRIHLGDTEKCGRCTVTDTIEHRLTEYAVVVPIWNWTRTHMAAILRTDQISIIALAFSPKFDLWFLRLMITYVLQRRRQISVIDYMDYM
jgi:hypothetical protein